MGFNPTIIPTAYPKTNVPATKERLLLLQDAQKEANAAHDLARQKMMERITRGFTPFKKGDKVWLESKHLKLRYEAKKMVTDVYGKNFIEPPPDMIEGEPEYEVEAIIAH